jgi:hypothetical protein
VPLYCIEADREAIVTDIWYVSAPSLTAAMAAVEHRPENDMLPHLGGLIDEYTSEETISEEGSREITEVPRGIQPYLIR